MTGGKSFPVGIDFESVLRAISKQIYEMPLAFIRENVQNAIDAVRIQALRDKADPGDARYGVDIAVGRPAAPTLLAATSRRPRSLPRNGAACGGRAMT